MVEGWGLPDESRFSNLLERVIGVEHLNFGMSHFSPYQSYLVYRDLASGFDHDAVVIGITPENDFVDLDLDRARDNLGRLDRRVARGASLYCSPSAAPQPTRASGYRMGSGTRWGAGQ